METDAATPSSSGERPAGAALSPSQWPWALAASPEASSESTGWTGALIRRWNGTSAVMVQPPLDHHYLVMHLGGAKHVTRRQDGPGVSCAVESGSVTLVPAGTAYTWQTAGPIAFAHLYLRPGELEDGVCREFDVDGRGATLVDHVGLRDPWLASLFGGLLMEIEQRGHASALRLDGLLDNLITRLARRHVSRVVARSGESISLAPHCLRRVVDYIDCHLESPLRLADLVSAAGTSASHFSHAFRASTGRSPYRYLLERRIERARALLLTCDDPLDAISARCGFNSHHQFTVAFKRIVGVGPKRYLTALRAPRRPKGGSIAIS